MPPIRPASHGWLPTVTDLPDGRCMIGMLRVGRPSVIYLRCVGDPEGVRPQLFPDKAAALDALDLMTAEWATINVGDDGGRVM